MSEEEEVSALVTTFHHSLPFHEFREVELGVCHHFHEIGSAHAFEKGKLE